MEVTLVTLTTSKVKSTEAISALRSLSRSNLAESDEVPLKFVRDKLFKPFVTTNGNAGMGIGVYEAREVARGLGGSLDVESQPGEGTKFSLTIPVSENDGVEPVKN